jgi:hypothetical protein
VAGRGERENKVVGAPGRRWEGDLRWEVLRWVAGDGCRWDEGGGKKLGEENYFENFGEIVCLTNAGLVSFFSLFFFFLLKKKCHVAKKSDYSVIRVSRMDEADRVCV